MAIETVPPQSLNSDPCIVLTHPAFDRPPVRNERRRGRTKGAHSLAVARRDRRARLIAECLAPCTTPSEPSAEAQTSARLAPSDAHAGALCPRDPLASTRARHEDAVIGAALAIIEERLRVQGSFFGHCQAVKDYLRLQLAGNEREVFGVMFLDAQFTLIAFEVLFEGTLTCTAVHPREMARRALQHNAAAVILAHNHPSGHPEPSLSDEVLTEATRKALSLLDVRVIDHVLVAGTQAVSFAERGLL